MPVFAVMTARGQNWDASRGIRDQDEWETHAAYMDKLVDEGVIILGGPVEGDPGEIALLAMRADSAGHVHSLFDADPWVVSGILRLASVRPWTIWLGSVPGERCPLCGHEAGEAPGAFALVLPLRSFWSLRSLWSGDIRNT